MSGEGWTCAGLLCQGLAGLVVLVIEARDWWFALFKHGCVRSQRWRSCFFPSVAMLSSHRRMLRSDWKGDASVAGLSFPSWIVWRLFLQSKAKPQHIVCGCFSKNQRSPFIRWLLSFCWWQAAASAFIMTVDHLVELVFAILSDTVLCVGAFACGVLSQGEPTSRTIPLTSLSLLKSPPHPTHTHTPPVPHTEPFAFVQPWLLNLQIFMPKVCTVVQLQGKGWNLQQRRPECWLAGTWKPLQRVSHCVKLNPSSLCRWDVPWCN